MGAIAAVWRQATSGGSAVCLLLVAISTLAFMVVAVAGVWHGSKKRRGWWLVGWLWQGGLLWASYPGLARVQWPPLLVLGICAGLYTLLAWCLLRRLQRWQATHGAPSMRALAWGYLSHEPWLPLGMWVLASMGQWCDLGASLWGAA